MYKKITNTVLDIKLLLKTHRWLTIKIADIPENVTWYNIEE